MVVVVVVAVVVEFVDVVGKIVVVVEAFEGSFVDISILVGSAELAELGSGF